MSIRILLADDHAIVRHGLSRAFQQESEFEIIAQANNGLSTMSLVRDLQPDIVVMDISMPDLNGIEATRQIVRDYPKVKVIGLSMHSSNKYIQEMFRAGASGYLLKNAPFKELVEAIKIVAEGKTYISPLVSEVVVRGYTAPEKMDNTAYAVLSVREREVLQQLSEGKTTKQIGLKLHISPKTVEVHRLNIMKKLQIDNIAQLTKYAIQEGLTEDEP